MRIRYGSSDCTMNNDIATDPANNFGVLPVKCHDETLGHPNRTQPMRKYDSPVPWYICSQYLRREVLIHIQCSFYSMHVRAEMRVWRI